MQGSFGVCSRYISLPNPTTQRRDIKKSERRGFLCLRITVNPSGFCLISPMKFNESENKTQKHDNTKGAHYIISFQCKQRSQHYQACITSFLVRKVEYQKEIKDRQYPKRNRLEFPTHLLRIFPTPPDNQTQNKQDNHRIAPPPFI